MVVGIVARFTGVGEGFALEGCGGWGFERRGAIARGGREAGGDGGVGMRGASWWS